MSTKENWKDIYNKCVSYFTIDNIKYGIIESQYYQEIVSNKYVKINYVPKNMGNAVWYGVTACNPLNTKQDAETNKIASDKLLSDLKLLKPTPTIIINPEHDDMGDDIGYRLKYNISKWNKNIDKQIIKLLQKYKQAGLYKWYKDTQNNENNNFIQEIIPCFKEWNKIKSSNIVTIFYVKQISSKL